MILCSCIVARADAPWCGHCKSLAPEWAAAAAKTRRLDPPVILAKVDADKHRELGEKFDVSGFPTIKVFRKGTPEDYDGPREAKGIVAHIKKDLGITAASSLTKLTTADEVKALAASGEAASLIGVFREPMKASAIANVFSEVAADGVLQSLKPPCKAYYSASYAKDPVATELGVSPPAIVLLKPGAEPVSMKIPRKREEFTEDALIEWVEKSLA